MRRIAISRGSFPSGMWCRFANFTPQVAILRIVKIGDAMKVITCLTCGRKVMVGNASKTTICALCKKKLSVGEVKEAPEYSLCANERCRRFFVPKVPWQKYCCYACKVEDMPKAEQIEKECLVCGKSFKGTSRQKYCSKECRALSRKVIKKDND